MSNDNDLLNQLKDLPNEASAPDRWPSIEQKIAEDAGQTRSDTDNEHSGNNWWAIAAVACVLIVTVVVGNNMLSNPQGSVQDSTVLASSKDKSADNKPHTFQLTIESLQQANAYYYAKLGNQTLQNDATVSPKTWASLHSLRDAQKQYLTVLTINPESDQAKERLFWLYQKERQLLRQLIV